jgi:ribose/xylose/arabinose/galactoside ABC-type transport system permease subunit
MIQASLMPLTASGAFSTTLMTLAALFILVLWIIVVLIERKNNSPLFDQKISQRTRNWIILHTLIVCWILVAHMGLVFFFGRLPFESQLDTIGTDLGAAIGFLINLPVERFDLVTYVFDINLIILAVLFGYEQFKVGYNLQNKPWPKISFRFLWITVALGLLLLPFNLHGIIP